MDWVYDERGKPDAKSRRAATKRQAESVSIPTHPLRAAKGRGWVGSETREAHEKALPFKGQSPSFFESERDYVGLREPCGS